MRWIVLLCTVGLIVSASPTTITGYLLGPDRRPAVCTVRVSSPVDFVTPDGKTVKAGVIATKSTDAAGFLTIALESTMTSNPSNFAYNVQFSCGGSAKWLVPASATPIDISVVSVNPAPPAPPAQVALSQLARGGATLGQVLCSDGTNWHPCDSSGTIGGIGGAGAIRFGVDFTNTVAVVIPGSQHKLSTADLIINEYDASAARKKIEGDVAVNRSTYDVTVAFAAPQSGRIVLQGSSAMFASSFTGQRSIRVLGSDHKLGSANLDVAIYDGAGAKVDCDYSVDAGTYDVNIYFAQAQSGRYVIQ